MRKHTFEKENYYHIYNRGTDKRQIFLDQKDLLRFLEILESFNVVNPIGSLYQNSFKKGGEKEKLVSIIAYCLNPNHFHLILTPLVDGGIPKFMQRIGTGYTRYFNERQNRNGVLFQGKFKSKHIDSNEYLLHAGVYVNMNNIDEITGEKYELSKSSMNEYQTGKNILCDTDIILEQFSSRDEYIKYAKELWQIICEKKNEMKDLDFT